MGQSSAGDAHGRPLARRAQLVFEKSNSLDGMGARKELDAMLASARKYGYLSYEFQARLALDEIELSSGSPSAKRRLRSLENEAREKGMLLIADEAAAHAKAS